jgi:hypothetical protein
MITEEKKHILIKVLNLTQSNQDGEALSALRTANKILREYDLTWASIVSRMTCQHCEEKEDIETMMKVVREYNFPGSWNGNLIVRLEQSYRKAKFLTPRQLEDLKRAYESSK